MPLSMARRGEENYIKRLMGSAEIRRHLENLGFVIGAKVKVINGLNGDLIVSVKESRVAISKEMAEKILV